MLPMRNKFFGSAWLATVLVLVALDQTLKQLLIEFSPEIVSYNDGGSFGIFSDSCYYKYIILAITVPLLIFFILSKREDKLPYALIASGAISNLIDRFLREGVVDYIRSDFWPSFNTSDAIIFLGVVLILFKVLLRREPI